MNDGKIREFENAISNKKDNLLRINSLIDEHTREIERINNNEGQYATMPREQKEMIKAALQNEVETLQSYSKDTKKNLKDADSCLNGLRGLNENTPSADRERVLSDYKKVTKAQKKIEGNLKRGLNRRMQGRIADRISATLFNNVNRRIQNRLYRHDEDWKKHVEVTESRYHRQGFINYVATRGAAIAALAILATPIGLTVPVLGAAVGLAAQAYAVNVGARILGIAYNKIRYGKPRLERKRFFAKGPGSYARNRGMAEFGYNYSKGLESRYSAVLGGPVPATPSPAPAPTPTPTPATTNDLADLLTRLNTLTDDDLNNIDENYIENTLKPLYEGLHSHEADLTDSVRAKYNRLKTKITNYENDKRILQEVTNELNALTVTEVNDANYESIRNLCDKARPCAARLPEDLRNKYTDLVNKLNTYEANKRELEGITNSLNTYATQGITEENVEEIREFYNRARARVADLSEDARNKLSIIGNKLRNYGSRRVDDDSSEYSRIASEIDNLGRDDLINPEEEDILFNLFPIYRVARNFESRFKEDTLVKYNILKKICLDYIKSRENRRENTASDEMENPKADEIVNDEMLEPNIDDYGNLNLGMIDISDEYKKNRLPFSKAISAARRIDVQDASDEDLERKIAGYDRLYKSLGTGRPNNNAAPNSQLSDYNRTLKQLAEYGRKVHSGKATTKEKNAYVALLYHLGKDDEFITTFLEDECDRYMADRAEFEGRRRK